MAKISPPLNKGTSGKMIRFYQPDPDRAADSKDNGSIIPWRQIDHECRFGWICKTKASQFNGVLL
jgi:hypothetical protein